MNKKFKIIDTIGFDEPFVLMTEIFCTSPWQLLIVGSHFNPVLSHCISFCRLWRVAVFFPPTYSPRMLLMSAQPTRRLRAVSVWCVWCVWCGVWGEGAGSLLIGYKVHVCLCMNPFFSSPSLFPLLLPLPLSSLAVELGAQDHASECRCMVAARPSGQQTSVSLGTYTIQWRRWVKPRVCDSGT